MSGASTEGRPGNSDATFTAFAPAKINLFLHIVGRRDDGLHELESIFAFTDIEDRLRLTRAEDFSLSLSGPFAGELQDADDNDNLVMKAARLLATEAGHRAFPARIELEKNLPIAAGIGGGSADAAATLLGLSILWDIELPADRFHILALELGADVPACLGTGMIGVKGIGEIIVPCVAPQVQAHIVLANPGVPLSTAAVFGRYRSSAKAFSTPLDHWPRWPQNDFEAYIDALSDCRNDLTDAAITEAPIIADVLAELKKEPGCSLARMSGSGSTCFGLFTNSGTAFRASLSLQDDHPDWWVPATELH